MPRFLTALSWVTLFLCLSLPVLTGASNRCRGNHSDKVEAARLDAECRLNVDIEVIADRDMVFDLGQAADEVRVFSEFDRRSWPHLDWMRVPTSIQEESDVWIGNNRSALVHRISPERACGIDFFDSETLTAMNRTTVYESTDDPSIFKGTLDFLISINFYNRVELFAENGLSEVLMATYPVLGEDIVPNCILHQKLSDYEGFANRIWRTYETQVIISIWPYRERQSYIVIDSVIGMNTERFRGSILASQYQKLVKFVEFFDSHIE